MCPFMRVSASSSVSIFLHDCFRYGLLSRTQWYAVPDYSCCLYSSYAMLVFRLPCLLRPFASWAATLALWATLPTPLRRFLLRDVLFSLSTLALFFILPFFPSTPFTQRSLDSKGKGWTRARGVLASYTKCGLVYSFISLLIWIAVSLTTISDFLMSLVTIACIVVWTASTARVGKLCCDVCLSYETAVSISLDQCKISYEAHRILHRIVSHWSV